MSNKDLDWDKAIEYIHIMRETYLEIGTVGIFGLIIINKLLARYENGERTQELYNEILAVE